jgi:predicted RNase H-like HicB family nuclease
MSGIKESGFFQVNCFITWDEDGCFRECVCDCKYCIVCLGMGEFGDEVKGNGFEGECVGI